MRTQFNLRTCNKIIERQRHFDSTVSNIIKADFPTLHYP